MSAIFRRPPIIGSPILEPTFATNHFWFVQYLKQNHYHFHAHSSPNLNPKCFHSDLGILPDYCPENETKIQVIVNRK